jgi:DNA invertase Pin-like site-specific DNA recombinase
VTTRSARCALWARVSGDEQETANQLAELREWAAGRGLEVVTEYVLDGGVSNNLTLHRECLIF